MSDWIDTPDAETGRAMVETPCSTCHGTELDPASAVTTDSEGVAPCPTCQ